MKKLTFIFGLLVLTILAISCSPRNTACTADAKICPDGTAVGRTGPNCEFAACPSGCNYDEPNKKYAAKNVEQCSVIMFNCESNREYFSDSCGCGCKLKETGINGPATTDNTKITNFEECIAAGNPAMESYPRQCRADGQTFDEEIEEKEPVCGNDICEEGEADDPGGCGPDTDPRCLGPPARIGTCPEDCKTVANKDGIKVNVPSSFSLLRGQTAQIVNYQDMQITLIEFISTASIESSATYAKLSIGSSGGCGPYADPIIDSDEDPAICLGPPAWIGEFSLKKGETIDIKGLKLRFDNIDGSIPGKPFADFQVYLKEKECIPEGEYTLINAYTATPIEERIGCCEGLVPKSNIGIADAPELCIKIEPILKIALKMEILSSVLNELREEIIVDNTKYLIDGDRFGVVQDMFNNPFEVASVDASFLIGEIFENKEKGINNFTSTILEIKLPNDFNPKIGSADYHIIFYSDNNKNKRFDKGDSFTSSWTGSASSYKMQYLTEDLDIPKGWSIVSGGIPPRFSQDFNKYIHYINPSIPPIID